MAGVATGLFHFVFGKPGAKAAKSADAPKAWGEAPGESPADAPEPEPPRAEAIPDPVPEPGAEPAPIPTPEPIAAPTPAPLPEPISADLPAASPLPAAPIEIHAEMQLTPHFKLAEFIHSDTAKRHKIPNLPDEAQLANLRVAAEGMENVRALLGGRPIHITSGFRSKELNSKIPGSSETSDHMEGFSVDFGRAGMTPYEITEALAANRALMSRVDQLIYEKARWVHISFAPARRGEILTAYERADKGKRTFYINGLHKLDEHGRLPATS